MNEKMKLVKKNTNCLVNDLVGGHPLTWNREIERRRLIVDR